MHQLSPEIARAHVEQLTRHARRARLVATAHAQRRNRKRRELTIRLSR
jgi:hypothetical protein